jgi:exonuclease SbcC
MILDSLEIISFGFLAARKVEFNPGLNIILGPNEAGKTTLFQAMLHTLLTPVKLSKPNFRTTMAGFIPLGGGDTIGCKLGFTSLNRSYMLTKNWGGKQAAELVLPDGGRITDDQRVSALMKELLPVREGTVRSILMTYQSALAGTLADLEKNRETLDSLSAILRRTILETDGISVERFKALLEEKYSEACEHWDPVRKNPENNRGIDNPYKKGVGRILKAYYSYQELCRFLDDVKAKEDSYGVKTGKLEECMNELAAKEAFLSENQQSAADAGIRSLVGARLDAAELTMKKLQSVYDSWPVLTARLGELTGSIPLLEQDIVRLEGEKQSAVIYEEGKELKKRCERAAEKREQLNKAEEKLAKAIPFSRGDLEEIEQQVSTVERLKAALEGGKLNLKLQAKTDIALTVENDLREAEEKKIASGESLEVSSNGLVRLNHADWSLEVKSGGEDQQKKAVELRETEAKLEALFQAKGVASLKEAKSASYEYQTLGSEVENAAGILKRELEDYSYEELQEKAAALEKEAPSRSLPGILEELLSGKHKLEQQQSEREETALKLKALTGEYSSKDHLFSRLVELGGEKKELELQLSELKAIPESFTDSDSFIQFYEGKKQAAAEQKEEKNRLEIECVEMEAKMPDESSEEIAVRLKQAEAIYKAEVKKGEIIARIKHRSESMLKKLDSNTFAGYERSIAAYIAELTADRYRSISLEGSLPRGVIREDGATLFYSLLSAGTKDVFGLALRLAMADYFLKEQDGFLVMDDPLVDLDPHRQELAAGVLSRFAEEKQLILFTCHPANASLFPEAKAIELKV